MFFVEAHYHHNPKRAADQVRYIVHREEGLRDGQRRQLYGIGPRYRVFRGTRRPSARPSSRTPEDSGTPSTSASSSPSTTALRSDSPASTGAWPSASKGTLEPLETLDENVRAFHSAARQLLQEARQVNERGTAAGDR
jgi:hypothetical protein